MIRAVRLAAIAIAINLAGIALRTGHLFLHVQTIVFVALVTLVCGAIYAWIFFIGHRGPNDISEGTAAIFGASAAICSPSVAELVRSFYLYTHPIHVDFFAPSMPLALMSATSNLRYASTYQAAFGFALPALLCFFKMRAERADYARTALTTVAIALVGLFVSRL
jgi:hypothetical protein